MKKDGFSLNNCVKADTQLNPNGKPTIEPSQYHQGQDLPIKNSEREKFLESIKAKIREGFYNTENVIDDLSHGFAEALDQTI